MNMKVSIETCAKYDVEAITDVFHKWEDLFSSNIKPGYKVVLKPNWLAEAHKYDRSEWRSVITHPTVITAVLKVVLDILQGHGKVSIVDAPQTDSSWDKIMKRMQPEVWIEMGRKAGIEVEIIDLREDEWVSENGVIIARKKLKGDPRGSTECDLNGISEFMNHPHPKLGYYGADYNQEETNSVHSNGHHKYRVSRTVIESDVFINLPKMKTHKKTGITCSIKNLVGINTYKNWLPHHSLGTQEDGGDQFPNSTMKNKVELVLVNRFKAFLSHYPHLGKWLVPLKKLGAGVFGESTQVIRSGNWYGNDTIWRMALDLNKILLYSNPDGTLREDSFDERKRYISIVDGIIAGEGNGPEFPDPKFTGILMAGTNPVAVDSACARIMGFDWEKIPLIRNAFEIGQYPICDFRYEDINIVSSIPAYNKRLTEISEEVVSRFRPHFGLVNHIEL